MQVDGNKLKFDKTLWVQYEGVESAEEGDQLVVTARSDDAYVKVFNQFGRLLKLYTFSNGRWIDSETGAEPASFDEKQAGRITAQPAAAPAARKPAAAVKKRKKAAAAARRSGAAMTMAKRKPGKKSVKGKSAAKSKSGGMRMMAKKKATVKKKTAKKPAKRKAPARKKTKRK
jgi:hypothetical protein